MDTNLGYIKTIKRYTVAGAAWTLLATFAGFFNQHQLYMQSPSSDSMLSFGILRPIYTNALIFGALLSFVIAAFYYLIQKSNEIQFKWEWVGSAVFVLHQSSVVLGIITILCGYNTGREYGEMAFLADKLLILSLIILLVGIVKNTKDIKNPSRATIFAVISISGGLAVYFLGNFVLPYSLFAGVHLNSGTPDTSVQEFYRTGVLGFFVILPIFSALFYFVPSYNGVELYSKKMANFQALAMLILISIAGSAGMVYSSTADVSHSVGIIATFLLSISIFIGIFHIKQMYRETSKNDALNMIIKTGLYIMLAMTFLRALQSTRYMQFRTGYTWWNSLDIAVDAQSYGIFIMIAVVGIMIQRITGYTLDKKFNMFFLYFTLVGLVIIITSNVAHGIIESLALNKVGPDGTMVVSNWADVIYAGSFASPDEKLKVITPMSYYIKSMRGITFIGFNLLLVGMIIGSLNLMKTSLSNSGVTYNE